MCRARERSAYSAIDSYLPLLLVDTVTVALFSLAFPELSVTRYVTMYTRPVIPTPVSRSARRAKVAIVGAKRRSLNIRAVISSADQSRRGLIANDRDERHRGRGIAVVGDREGRVHDDELVIGRKRQERRPPSVSRVPRTSGAISSTTLSSTSLPRRAYSLRMCACQFTTVSTLLLGRVRGMSRPSGFSSSASQ
jgi:hypothetical protein